MRRRLPGWARLTLIVVSVSLLVPVVAQAQLLEVKTVPWVPTNPLIPHDTWMGKQVTLKGTANVSSGTWTWDFGDGSAVATGPIDASNGTGCRRLTRTLGTPGTVYTARLTVESGAETRAAPYYVAIRPRRCPSKSTSRSTRGCGTSTVACTAIRMEAPLRELDIVHWRGTRLQLRHQQLLRATAMNVNAFLVNGHLEGGSPANPYTESVGRAMRQLFAWLTWQAIGLQTNGLGTFNPDVERKRHRNPRQPVLRLLPGRHVHVRDRRVRRSGQDRADRWDERPGT